MNGRVAPGNAAKEKAFVQKRKHAFGFHAGFVDAAKCANCERSIQRRRKAFSGDVADVQTDRFITEPEVVEIVASHFRHWLKFVGDGHTRVAQRMRGHHDVLNDASFFEFLLAKLFNRMQIQRKKRGVHEPIRRGE